MTTMFGDLNEPKPSDLLDPKHWFVVSGDGPFGIRNFTKRQDLLGEYTTKESANRMIKRISRGRK